MNQNQENICAGASHSARDAQYPSPTENFFWPPGFAGQLAKFIYSSSYLPVREVAIAATLGLLAGVCGRAFTISGKSSSLYIILIARSGIGKDGIHEGIHNLISLAGVPGAEKFVQSTDFASGPALHKALLTQPGFLNLQGEFGRKLKRMSNMRDTPMQDLRTVMTDAYSKKFLDGKSYSSNEKTLRGVLWPALSFLGETTPGTFYEALTPDMLADGFMSRFIIISYDGERPQPNEDRCIELKPEDLARLRAIMIRALPYQQTVNMPAPIEVAYANEGAKDKMWYFERECGNAVNAAGNDEPKRQLWNRAYLKALQIASLLAVADNEIFPKIDLGHATWAITAVRHNIKAFNEKLTSGDIGIDDHSRENKLLSIIEKYLRNPPMPSYKINPEMRLKGIITRKYLQQNISSSSSFISHKLGATGGLDATLRSLIDSGFIVEVDKMRILEDYGVFGKCYRIVDLPNIPS